MRFLSDYFQAMIAEIDYAKSSYFKNLELFLLSVTSSYPDKVYKISEKLVLRAKISLERGVTCLNLLRMHLEYLDLNRIDQ